MSCQESSDLAPWRWSFAEVVRTPCLPGERGGRVGDNAWLFRGCRDLMVQRMLGLANNALPGSAWLLPWG